MGGQNHKPTKKIFAVVSALLSEKIEEAFIASHTANIFIERTLVATSNEYEYLVPEEVRQQSNDLKKAILYFDKAIEQLETSLQKLEEVDKAYNLLMEALSQEGYEGNPLAPQLYNLHLDEQFHGTILMPYRISDIWEDIAEKIANHNLPAAFRFEQDLFQQLQTYIRELLEVMRNARPVVHRGQFIEALESNEIPLRTYFARLFSYWYYVMTLFLYSTLISTELFYRSEGLPSLTAPVLAQVHHARP